MARGRSARLLAWAEHVHRRPARSVRWRAQALRMACPFSLQPGRRRHSQLPGCRAAWPPWRQVRILRPTATASAAPECGRGIPRYRGSWAASRYWDAPRGPGDRPRLSPNPARSRTRSCGKRSARAVKIEMPLIAQGFTMVIRPEAKEARLGNGPPPYIGG